MSQYVINTRNEKEPEKELDKLLIPYEIYDLTINRETEKIQIYFIDNPENQFNFPILTVRDNDYSMWQKLKFYSNYFYNINKPIFFKVKPPYYKNISIYKRLKNKLFN